MTSDRATIEQLANGVISAQAWNLPQAGARLLNEHLKDHPDDWMEITVAVISTAAAVIKAFAEVSNQTVGDVLQQLGLMAADEE